MGSNGKSRLKNNEEQKQKAAAKAEAEKQSDFPFQQYKKALHLLGLFVLALNWKLENWKIASHRCLFNQTLLKKQSIFSQVAIWKKVKLNYFKLW